MTQENYYQELVQKADSMAEKAHEGQYDKAGLPYITHPRKVASFVTDPREKIVALLHDTVEDTDMTIEEIQSVFGEEIAQAVALMTHAEGVPYMDYVEKIKSNPLARHVKMADLTHNMDLSRLPLVTDKAKARLEKYKKAYAILKEADKNEPSHS